MNNSVFTMTKSLCIKLNFDHELYKTILDILYMVGIFLGGEFFIHLGSSHGRTFSLGLAMFMTLIGSSISSEKDSSEKKVLQLLHPFLWFLLIFRFSLVTK